MYNGLLALNENKSGQRLSSDSIGHHQSIESIHWKKNKSKQITKKKIKIVKDERSIKKEKLVC